MWANTLTANNERCYILGKGGDMPEHTFLYHGFRNDADVQIVDGNIPTSCRGTGAGGQKSGFYVWNNVAKTAEYLGFCRLAQNGVICQIQTPLKQIKYPDWQFDYESLGVLDDTGYVKHNALRQKMADMLEKYQAECPNLAADMQNAPEGFSLLGIVHNKNGARVLVSPNATPNLRTALYEGNVQLSGCEQTLNDYMCAHSAAYRQEYDRLLLEALECHGVALKYVGAEKLKVHDVFNADGKVDNDLRRKYLPDEKAPEMVYNDRTGMFEYKDTETQKRADKRLYNKTHNQDYLQYKLERIRKYLRYNHLDENMGKTGNTADNSVSATAKRVAQIQKETAKTSPEAFKRSRPHDEK